MVRARLPACGEGAERCVGPCGLWGAEAPGVARCCLLPRLCRLEPGGAGWSRPGCPARSAGGDEGAGLTPAGRVCRAVRGPGRQPAGGSRSRDTPPAGPLGVSACSRGARAQPLRSAGCSPPTPAGRRGACWPRGCGVAGELGCLRARPVLTLVSSGVVIPRWRGGCFGSSVCSGCTLRAGRLPEAVTAAREPQLQCRVAVRPSRTSEPSRRGRPPRAPGVTERGAEALAGVTPPRRPKGA